MDILGLEESLYQFCIAEEIDLLIAGHSFAAQLKAGVLQRLGRPGPSFTAVTICNNKYLAKSFYRDNSFIFPIDPFQPDEVNLRRVPKYPFLLKPGFGVLSIWQKLIKSEAEFIDYLEWSR